MPILTTSRGTFTFDHPDRWEITVQNIPAPVTKITISAAGLYVEAGQLRWDLIPWPELAAMIDGDGAPTLRAIPVVGEIVDDGKVNFF